MTVNRSYLDAQKTSGALDLGSIWDRFGINLGSIWDQFGIILGSILDHFGIILGSFWGSFWDHLGINLVISQLAVVIRCMGGVAETGR